MLGRLSWSAVPLDQPIIMGTCGTIVAVLLALFFHPPAKAAEVEGAVAPAH